MQRFGQESLTEMAACNILFIVSLWVHSWYLS